MVNENSIRVKKFELLGKLPDPFVFDDGSKVKTTADWYRRRKEIYKYAIDLQYGTIPPKPEVFRVEAMYLSPVNRSYRIICGTKEKTLSFRMKLILPEKPDNSPIIVDGDLCFAYTTKEGYIDTPRENGIGWALFDRTELANDIDNEGRRKGPLYEIYPDYTFGSIGAWAWGYMRVVDALMELKLDGIDLSKIVFTGHSRGGKTCALAGALDERAWLVNPNATCAGACGCYRIHMSAETDETEEKRSETLYDLYTRLGFWMGEGMEEYMEREQDLPFDCHYLKAMVAPRILFISEAVSDMWANPIGSCETTLAAREVYKFLGAENNIYWYFREGFHFHKKEDIEMLVNIILHETKGVKKSDRFGIMPYKRVQPAFDFKAPENEDRK